LYRERERERGGEKERRGEEKQRMFFYLFQSHDFINILFRTPAHTIQCSITVRKIKSISYNFLNLNNVERKLNNNDNTIKGWVK
jgi:hypothetical protein